MNCFQVAVSVNSRYDDASNSLQVKKCCTIMMVQHPAGLCDSHCQLTRIFAAEDLDCSARPNGLCRPGQALLLGLPVAMHIAQAAPLLLLSSSQSQRGLWHGRPRGTRPPASVALAAPRARARAQTPDVNWGPRGPVGTEPARPPTRISVFRQIRRGRGRGPCAVPGSGKSGRDPGPGQLGSTVTVAGQVRSGQVYYSAEV